MTLVEVGVLLALGLTDGALAGFRSSLGRTGLIAHRDHDTVAFLRGLVIVAVALAPSALLAGCAVWRWGVPIEDFRGAGAVLLAVYLPYSAVTFAALLVYWLLPWRLKYLAMALILGPFTYVRVPVILAGLAGTLAVSLDPLVIIPAGLAVVGVLATQPLADRVWYRPLSVRRSRELAAP